MTTARATVTRFKIQRAITKDLQGGRIHAVVSTEAKDRQGDIIRQSGWRLDHFNEHPVLLSSHDYSSLRSQIGEWEEMAVKGKRLEGVAKYYVGEGNAEADWAYNLARKGRAAYSVGFQPDMALAKRIEDEDEDAFFGSWEFNGQELLEVSHVTIPANPEALQQMKGLAGLDPVMAQMLEEELAEAQAKTPGMEAPSKALVIARGMPEDMAALRERMGKMRGEMDEAMSMMDDMMEEMKGHNPKAIDLAESIKRGTREGLREARTRW